MHVHMVGNEASGYGCWVRVSTGKIPLYAIMLRALGLPAVSIYNKNFDEIFHLFVELHLDYGKRVIVEKNERINVAFGKRKGDKVEVEQLQNFSEGLTLNGMLEKTRQRMGEEAFFSYNAAKNNCQDFILNFLQANGVGTEANYSFVKQNTEQLFKRLPYLQNLAKGVTDVGADVGDKTDDMQRFIAGRGIPQ